MTTPASLRPARPRDDLPSVGTEFPGSAQPTISDAPQCPVRARSAGQQRVAGPRLVRSLCSHRRLVMQLDAVHDGRKMRRVSIDD